MTIQYSSALLDEPTVALLRPGYEGSNIGSWIGFKHINYLVESAVLDHFRAAGFAARSLYEEYGLCWELVDLDTRIATGFRLDDQVEAAVRAEPADRELAFAVRLLIRRDDTLIKGGSARVRVVLRRDGPDAADRPVPPELLPYVTDRISRPERDPAPALTELTHGTNAFTWRRRVPYPYCHFNQRLQMSGYLRQMEEVVDLFLADRGLSIKRMLDERSWIPVVPHSSITILDEVIMEEELHTVFTVENIFKRFTYTSRMDTYVWRSGAPVRTATGRITHGYAQIKNRRDFNLVEFDGRIMTALGGADHGD